MKVQIKTKDFMVDATIEVKDGVMLVSPVADVELKEKAFEPKDGDIVATEGGEWIFIFKENYNKETRLGVCCCAFKPGKDRISVDRTPWCFSRFATEEEIKKIFEAIKKHGYEWDSEKKELRKKRWMPEVGVDFYYPLWRGVEKGFPLMFGHSQTKAVY